MKVIVLVLCLVLPATHAAAAPRTSVTARVPCDMRHRYCVLRAQASSWS